MYTNCKQYPEGIKKNPHVGTDQAAVLRGMVKEMKHLANGGAVDGGSDGVTVPAKDADDGSEVVTVPAKDADGGSKGVPVSDQAADLRILVEARKAIVAKPVID